MSYVYLTLEKISHATIVGALVLFIVICMYLLNMVVNNLIVVSIVLVVVLSAVSLVLPRGVTGLMLFGFFLSFVILSLLLRNIEQGFFYGSLIMSLIFLVDIFNR